MMVSGGCQWVLCDGLGGVWSVRMESNSLIFANIRQYSLCFACLRTSDAPDAAHVPARGIQGVWELVHTLGGLEHPEITRDYAGGSLWVVDCTFVVMGWQRHLRLGVERLRLRHGRLGDHLQGGVRGCKG